ncbi:MAG: hypothetical protein ACFFCS_28300 [Candidatus Hodarchaeota archaeon]
MIKGEDLKDAMSPLKSDNGVPYWVSNSYINRLGDVDYDWYLSRSSRNDIIV